MKRLDDFMGYDSHLLLCLNAPDLSADYIIRNMQVYASQYIFKKSMNSPDIFFDKQQKGLKILVFKRS